MYKSLCGSFLISALSLTVWGSACVAQDAKASQSPAATALTAPTPGAIDGSAPVSTTPSQNAHLTTREVVVSVLSTILDKERIAALRTLAHQQAIAITCSAFDIDSKKFEAEMDAVLQDQTGKNAKLSDDERISLERTAMFGFGISLGGQISRASLDEKTFCDQAEDEFSSGILKHAVLVRAQQ
jgi:hypothetical protein